MSFAHSDGQEVFMHSISLVPLFDIQLFAEGGDGGAGAGNAGAGIPSTAAPAQPQTGVKDDQSAGVQFGGQNGAPAAGEQAQQQELDRAARFEAMIKGEFKDLYDARVQNSLRQRLRGNEETVNRYNQFAPVREILADKYGVDPNDPQAILKALDEDESFYEAEAAESGQTVQQIKENRKMKRENAALRAQLEQVNTQKQANELLASWQQQGEEVKKIYPGFDLQAELQNPMFRELLKSNIPIRTAFEVIHKDEIIPAAMQYTAKQVEQKVANSVRAGQMRPAEGAMGSASPAQHRVDVSKLTKAQVEEYNRRAARGERIEFT